ncbi:MerR family transcriptional regulator [Sphingopyxis sp. GW247-27LB]|uniref:MerR family transcriptional regulator n=1 Tax=Sphingopyxis sp. GW247-27LB TaxID=2012632 RepID=UPI001140EF82|nr:MerR family transcriptional regulator [Sphingopyxis sp. GW247-27LB]
MTIIFESFPAKKAAELAGFNTVAMLDYLQRVGVFVPRRRDKKTRGKRRAYEFRDVLVLKAIKRLLDSGASVSNLKRSLSQFQKMKWSADEATLEDAAGVIRYLIVSGNSVYLRKDPDMIVDLCRKGQLTFSFIIDLDNLHTELRGDLGLKVIEQPELKFPDTVAGLKA